MKRLAILTAVILLILLLVALLWQLRSVVLMFFLALAIAAALEAPIQRLMGWGWSRVLAILAVYGGVCGGLLLLAVLITTPTVRELDPMLQDLL
ncbi:MAG: AI-2E family transporter, partial [Caldilineaceae bacterium]|nr:AI-2E family transporter [Caldilineaceae bacterium]